MDKINLSLCMPGDVDEWRYSSTHSCHWHYMKASGQLNTTAVLPLPPSGRTPGTQSKGDSMGSTAGLEILLPLLGIKPWFLSHSGHSIVQSCWTYGTWHSLLICYPKLSVLLVSYICKNRQIHGPHCNIFHLLELLLSFDLEVQDFTFSHKCVLIQGWTWQTSYSTFCKVPGDHPYMHDPCLLRIWCPSLIWKSQVAAVFTFDLSLLEAGSF